MYEMRSQGFGHISKVPIALFTRALTGALVRRLHADDVGAQQPAADVAWDVVTL